MTGQLQEKKRKNLKKQPKERQSGVSGTEGEQRTVGCR